MSDSTLTLAEVEEAQLADWRPMYKALRARFKTGNFVTGLRLVNAIGEAAESANHHPDLDLRYGHLNVRLSSHDAGGITKRDIALARQISALAAAAGATPQPELVSALEVALDTPDFQRIKPFWRAVLGYRDNPRAEDEVRNDDGDLPTLWFQESGDEEPRQRFHLDVTVPKELVAQRVAAAVAAGGTVRDEASTFTVLSDPEGNQVCVCF